MGKARGTSITYPPTPPSTNALRYAGTTASEGYPPVAKSAEAQVPWLRIAQLRITHSSTGIARGLLRRRIRGRGEGETRRRDDLRTRVHAFPLSPRLSHSITALPCLRVFSIVSALTNVLRVSASSRLRVYFFLGSGRRLR